VSESTASPDPVPALGGIEQRVAGAGGAELRVNDSGGEGPTIVFTHGWADDSTAWAGTVAALGDDARCLTYDLRGHGDSDVPAPGNYTRDDAMTDLQAIIDLADGPVVLAGHSYGGYLSLAHTIAKPDQVLGLVLVAAGPGFRKDEAREQWNESVDVSAKKLGVPEGSEELSKHVDAWVIDSLSEITAPAVVIVGEYDKRFAASAAVFEKYLDVRSSIVVPDSGHSVHKKRGAAVAGEVRKLLAEIDS